ncbi:LysR family transcriptional regulator [Arthrobacter sp. H5]|uniref:LysR family transcriptional regulator n=1 Tax=Arthrobacter sp. H5 TaxID=1267973 RepID=UPI0004891872|nr:LysR family transcriptional regulator [Arthrobacter sp. H5]
MDIRHLKYFLGVVDHGGFGRAAMQLHIAQPSLSQAVLALERELGVQLFHRTGRHVVVSSSGRALIEPARRAVRDFDAFRSTVDSLKSRQVGQVDLALLPSQAVEPFSTVAMQFGKLYPGMTISAQPAYTSADVMQLLASGACELGLFGSAEFVPPPGIHLEPIEEQPMVLIGLPGQPFTDGSVVHHNDLTGARFITSPPGSVMRQVVDEILGSGIDAHIAVEVAHRSSVLPLVLAGGGLAVLTAAWTDLARKCGAAVMHLEPAHTLQVTLAYRTPAVMTPAAQAFAEVVREYASDKYL